MANETPVVMTIPEDTMRAMVQASVAQALTNGQPERFIAALVKDVLSQKAGNASDYRDRDKTILNLTIEKMISDVAKEFCREYVESIKPQIREAVEVRLKKRKAFAGEIADKLVAAISGNIYASISIKVDSQER